ncbi:hypothetical protein ACLB2K_001505 [Fragaria x ananassa]
MFIECNGILLNEALHWLGVSGGNKVILFAFDLAKEEFRRMSMPVLDEGDKLFDGIFNYKLRPLLVMEDSMLVGKWTYKTDAEAIRVGYDGVVLETNVLMDSGCQSLEYEESILRLDDYDVVEERMPRDS